jgi:hypothetical protein
MDLRSEITGRAIAVYAIASLVALVLTPFAWGLVGAILGSSAIARNAEYQDGIEAFFKARGIDPQDSSALQKLSKTDRDAMISMIDPILADINWFLFIVVVSVVVFCIVGFLGGLLARKWMLASAVPLLSLLGPNPLKSVKAEEFSNLEYLIIVCVQISICAGLAYWGSMLTSRQRKKDLA